MTLPFNEEAENSLLSTFMLSPDKVGCMMAERGVTEVVFHHPSNRVIASLLLEAWREGRTIDAGLLAITLRRRGLFDEVGGQAIFDRIGREPSAANASQFLDAVVETDHLRRLALLCAHKKDEALQPGADPRMILSDISTEVSAMASNAQPKRAKSMKEHIKEKMARMENEDDAKGIIQTGIEKLDLHSPLKRGDMPLISGERKAGKSILSLNIASNIALRGEPVVYFSLEDRAPKVIDRLFAKESKMPIIAHTIRGVSEIGLSAFQRAAVRLTEAPILLYDDVYDLVGIAATIRREKVKHPNLHVAVIDYAQLVRFQLPKGSSREQEVANISRTLRLLAMELDIAIILLCQLNKDGDTRESKALEQDCTAMWKVTHAQPEDSGKRIIVIPFQRNGDSSIAFPVTFLGATARIESYTGDAE